MDINSEHSFASATNSVECSYLGVHRLPVLRDHRALITVQRYGGVVKRLLLILQGVVKLRHSAVEYRTEVPGY